MPRYLFHLFNTTEIRDTVGREFANLGAARADEIFNARSLMAADIVSVGEITLSHSIEVEDDGGAVHVVAFRDAVTINP
jgi:hypothetical protein